MSTDFWGDFRSFLGLILMLVVLILLTALGGYGASIGNPWIAALGFGAAILWAAFLMTWVVNS